jgi:hypothetical protein
VPDGPRGWEPPGLLGILLLVTLPLWCCGVASLLACSYFYIQYGRGPGSDRLTEVQPGMTPDEVVSILGHPHKRSTEPDGTGIWIYHDDCLCYGYSGVRFDAAGRVTNAWVHWAGFASV